MIKRRLLVSILAGALLGVICIVGSQVRSGFSQESYYLFAFWYNRLVMGIFIGMIWPISNLARTIARGALIGAIVSLAFYSSTGFEDWIGFIAGIVYGILIEAAAYRWARQPGA